MHPNMFYTFRLAHIDQGLSNPTESATLHLVCRGTHHQQGDNQRTRLPITINLLQTLKKQLQLSSYYTIWSGVCCEQYSLLWFMDFSELVNFSRLNGLTLLFFQLKFPSMYIILNEKRYNYLNIFNWLIDVHYKGNDPLLKACQE